jgi:histidine ammonia-lyase
VICALADYRSLDQVTVILDTSRDLTLESLHQITRDGASCALSEEALDRVARRREEFLAFVGHNEDRHPYGITTKHHVGAKTVLDAASRDEFARRLPPTPAGFGECQIGALGRKPVLGRPD